MTPLKSEMCVCVCNVWTCVLGQAGAVAVTLCDRNAVLGAHCPPV